MGISGERREGDNLGFHNFRISGFGDFEIFDILKERDGDNLEFQDFRISEFGDFLKSKFPFSFTFLKFSGFSKMENFRFSDFQDLGNSLNEVFLSFTLGGGFPKRKFPFSFTFWK